MHVAVIGAGSLGSLLGGLLATRHRVTLVGRDDHMRAVAADGLEITGSIDRTVHPAATTAWSTVGEVDVCLLTVKSYDTESAAEELREDPPPTVVSVQNGLDNGQVLERVLGHRAEVLVGTATYGALLTEPGHVRCTGVGDVVFGAPDGSRSPTADGLESAWSGAITCRSSEAMPRRLWEKVIINTAINPVTALAGVPNGNILTDPLRPIAMTAAREAIRVARHEGCDLDVEDMLAEVRSVARQTSENESSMARDVRRGSRTEIEAITGAIIERSQSEQVPVNRVLYGLIAGYEMGAGIRNGESG